MKYIPDIQIHFTCRPWEISQVAILCDKKTSMSSFVFLVRKLRQAGPDVYTDANHRSVLFLFLFFFVGFGVWQSRSPAGRRKLQIQSHDRSVGKPKQLKETQAELWVWAATPQHLNNTRNSILPRCFFILTMAATRDDPFISKPKTRARHSWRADLKASSSFN